MARAGLRAAVELHVGLARRECEVRGGDKLCDDFSTPTFSGVDVGEV
jgi:hypothetical protein